MDNEDKVVKKNSLHNIFGLITSLIMVALVAFTGSHFSPGAWYQELIKPSWTPPSWLFGPAWTILYILMATAAWLVWRESKKIRIGPALSIYIIQLILNGLWSWIFFGLHEIGMALADLIALLIAIIITCVLFWKIKHIAGILILPYIGWVSFAGFLNYAIWMLNTKS